MNFDKCPSDHRQHNWNADYRINSKQCMKCGKKQKIRKNKPAGKQLEVKEMHCKTCNARQANIQDGGKECTGCGYPYGICNCVDMKNIHHGFPYR